MEPVTDRVGTAPCCSEETRGGSLVELHGRSRLTCATEDGGCVVDDERSAVGRPHHGTKKPALGVGVDGADGEGELSGLAAHLVIAPAGAGRRPGDTDRLQDLARVNGGLEGAAHQTGNRHRSVARAVGDNGVGAERG